MSEESDDQKKYNIWIFFSIILIIGAFFIGTTINKPVTSTDSNLKELNTCITEAQAEVDNNPDYQPIVGNAISQSLSQQEKVNAMQPLIADCKTKYPTN